MRVFVDTSAFYALVSATDEAHPAARKRYHQLLEVGAQLTTSSYVLVETVALVQRRAGLERARALHNSVQQNFRVLWVDEELHQRGWELLDAQGNRRLSLVDCVSFETMRSLGLRQAFAFDPHFREAGFDLLD